MRLCSKYHGVRACQRDDGERAAEELPQHVAKRRRQLAFDGVVHAALDHQVGDHKAGKDRGQADRQAPALGGDFESHRMRRRQVEHQQQPDEVSAGKIEPAAPVRFGALRENLHEPLEHLKFNAGKPYAKIRLIDDVPHAIVLLRERAHENKKYRQREENHREPQRGKEGKYKIARMLERGYLSPRLGRFPGDASWQRELTCRHWMLHCRRQTAWISGRP